MLLTEIFDRVLAESGQFILPVEHVELDVDRFLYLVRSALAQYNKYCPYDRRFNLQIMNGRMYEFQAEGENGIPDWLSEVLPLRLFGIIPQYIREAFELRHNFLTIRSEYPTAYRKPKLFVPVQGLFEIHAIYKHTVKTTEVAGKKIYEITSIDGTENNLFDLFKGMFLQGLGRSRRAFTINDLPISTDADSLVSEGKDVEKDAIEQLTETEMDISYCWG